MHAGAAEISDLSLRSIREDLLWTEWQASTPNKHGKNIALYSCGRVLDDMQSLLIENRGHKSIWKFLYNIPDPIKKSITSHQTDDMIYNDIVTKSEQFASVKGGGTAEHTKLGYQGMV